MKRLVRLGRRAAPLLRLATEYTAAHMATRLLAAISGLLLVRLLPVNEYGFYTLVLSAFTFICTFSDLGATETLSFFRWRAHKKNKSWIPYYHAVLRFRRTVFLLGFVASAAYIAYTGHHVGEDVETIVLGIALVGMAAWFAIQSGIISYVLKLEQRFRQSYAVELSNESAKLFAVGMIWLTGVATSVAGMAGVALGALTAVFVGSRLFEPRSAKNKIKEQGQRVARQSRRVLLGQIIPVIPGAIYFALQGPLLAGLAAYFGSVTNVAEVGALGRLGVLVGVIAAFSGSVFIPRLLAITDEKLFFRRYLQWWFVVVALGGFILLAIAIFPAEFLKIIGQTYSGLNNELFIAAASAVIGTWATYAWGVNRARGWVKYQPWSVPTMLCGQILMMFMLDFSSTAGVLLLGLGSALLGLGYQLFINAHGFFIDGRKMRDAFPVTVSRKQT